MKIIKNLLYATYFLTSIFVIAAYWRHEGPNHQIFIYSYKYFACLLAFTIALLLAIPLLFVRIKSRYGIKLILMSLIPLCILLVVIYQVAAYNYYSNRKYLFDPFLQRPKAVIDTARVDKSAVNVLCLGGSTTHGHDLPAGTRYTDALEQSLRSAYPNKKINVYNAGIPWYTSKHMLINYVTDYRRIEPDLVIVMEAINDIYRSFPTDKYTIGDFKEDYSHFYGSAINAARPPIFARVLYERYYNIFLPITRIFEKKDIRVDYGIEDFKAIHSFRYNMGTLLETVKRDGHPCIVLEQPYYYHDNYQQWEHSKYDVFSGMTSAKGKSASLQSLKMAMDEFNKTASDLAREKGMTFIRTKDVLPSSDTTIFMDDVHHTVKGARLLGQEVAKRIVETGILKNLKTPK